MFDINLKFDGNISDQKEIVQNWENEKWDKLKISIFISSGA